MQKTSYRPQLLLADFNVATAFQRQAKKGEPELIPSAYSRQGGVDDPALWLTGLYGPGSGKRLPSWMRGGAYLHEVPHACREVLVALRSGQVVTPNSATCGAWGLPG